MNLISWRIIKFYKREKYLSIQINIIEYLWLMRGNKGVVQNEIVFQIVCWYQVSV